ncbi:hypothetical protein [Planctobacterium marinum]|uniref:hypothetical protein n=1 Tax=Planctobacterium marinum TaxID=1631968 RepID=UPI001E59A768|nr:hypothetical protein [Planctobacterium marinum]MCC2604049.1 hypothetical protein [Planctobacterium marinum]
MSKYLPLLLITLSLSTSTCLAQQSAALKLYNLELGGDKTLQQQLGVSPQSFFLSDGNNQEPGKSLSVKERAENQIACKQSGFGVGKVLSQIYHDLAAQDEYLEARKESLNQRIKEDLSNTEKTVIHSVSKRFAQPVCHWAFNSAEYVNKEVPTVVTKFINKSGVKKLATLTFSVNHSGKLLSLKAEQLVERLDSERLDTILAAIAKRYNIEIDAIAMLSKTKQKQILDGKQAISFQVDNAQCDIQVSNTYYRSDAAARFFGVEEAHGYIEFGCQLPALRDFDDAKLAAYVTQRVTESVSQLLAKHKAQMKAEGQKEQHSGFVF